VESSPKAAPAAAPMQPARLRVGPGGTLETETHVQSPGYTMSVVSVFPRMIIWSMTLGWEKTGVSSSLSTMMGPLPNNGFAGVDWLPKNLHSL
jgi:hypothetical protein